MNQSLGAKLTKRIRLDTLIYTGALYALVAVAWGLSLVQFEQRQARSWISSFSNMVQHEPLERFAANKYGDLDLIYKTQLFHELTLYDADGKILYSSIRNTPALMPTETTKIYAQGLQKPMTLQYRVGHQQLGNMLIIMVVAIMLGMFILIPWMNQKIEKGIQGVMKPFHAFIRQIENLSSLLEKRNAAKEIKSVPKINVQESASEETLALHKTFEGLIQVIQQREEMLTQHSKDSERQHFLDEMAKSAAMLSHDIRSPLTALQVLFRDSTHMPENTKILIRDAITRIGDIANSLDLRRGASMELKDVITMNKINPEPLSHLISSVLGEKRMQLRNLVELYIGTRIETPSLSAFARVNAAEFQRIISNLVDNSVDAVQGKGAINVLIIDEGSHWKITVRDNGPGIPKEKLSRVAEFGETWGKTGGKGLGLYHAKLRAQDWNGSLKIESEPGKTDVSVVLPKCSPPPWFATKVVIPPKAELIILDDDPAIHEVWEHVIPLRVRESISIELVHFLQAHEVWDWLTKNPSKGPRMYFFDQELPKFANGGISILEKLPNGYPKYLVTSHINDLELRQRCMKAGVQLIPKPNVSVMVFYFGHGEKTAALIPETKDVNVA